MFKSRSEGNVVYKVTIRLFEDDSIIEAEFQVRFSWLQNFLTKFFSHRKKKNNSFIKIVVAISEVVICKASRKMFWNEKWF